MTENDAVSRKWLLNHYDAEHQGPPGRVRELIESAPPVDAVKHSYWITYSTTHFSKKDGSERKHNEYRCAACSRWTVVREKFCPECGTKMDHICASCRHYHEHRHDRGDDSRCARHNMETRAAWGCEEWEARDV